MYTRQYFNSWNERLWKGRFWRKAASRGHVRSWRQNGHAAPAY
jgi:hypothetical protein